MELQWESLTGVLLGLHSVRLMDRSLVSLTGLLSALHSVRLMGRSWAGRLGL